MPEDALQLNSLRERAGIDITQLAKRHSLSVHQLRQLEEGGDDRFYSAAIKLQVGRKLLHALGGDLADLAPEADALATTEVESSVKPQPLHASTAVKDATASSGVPKARLSWWVPVLGVVLMVLVWAGWQQWMPQAKLSTLPSNDRTAQVFAPQAQHAAQGESTALPIEPLVAPADASSEQANALSSELAAATPDCAFGSDPKRVSVFEPRRPGNYVYFEAQQAVSICVRDAEQQVTTLDLPAGRGRTVRGSAPFEVLSDHFEGMRIFYQGKLVAPGLLTQSHILLRPQAIVAPTTEVN